MTGNFLSDTWRSEGNNVFQVLKEKNCQLRILYLVKISFRNEDTWIYNLKIRSVFKTFIRLIFHLLIVGNSFASCLLSCNIGHHFSRLQYNFLVDLVSQTPYTVTSLRYQSRSFLVEAVGNTIIPDIWRKQVFRKPAYLSENKQKNRNQILSFREAGGGMG